MAKIKYIQDWVCLVCWRINPYYKPNRKRKEVNIKCLKCGSTKPQKVI